MPMRLAILLPLILPLLTALAIPPPYPRRQLSTLRNSFQIVNRCPASINLYDGGEFYATVPSGGTVAKYNHSGYFYTDANGGKTTGVGTTRAGFYDADGLYFMVKDADTPLNTGMRITPVQRPSPTGDYCASIGCDTKSCPSAFETGPGNVPPPNTIPPPPWYRCQVGDTTYIVTFCPSGAWPLPETFHVHPILSSPSKGKCLDVRGAVFANGTPVQVYDCNGTPAQNFVLSRGSTKVKLAGTNFCLDAGSAPASGVGMKIWQCIDNLPAQQWVYTADNQLVLEGKGQCLDLPRGELANGGQVQTWQCGVGNQNQIWIV